MLICYKLIGIECSIGKTGGFMRELIRKFGRGQTVVLFSTFAVVVSLLATLIIEVILNVIGIDINLRAGLWIAVFVTLCVAPIMIWHMIDLF